MKTEFSGVCDWCKNEADDLVEHQDFEEGTSGREYDVCLNCRQEEARQIEINESRSPQIE